MIATRPKYSIKTFGCQMNYSDSERVSTYLESLGYDQGKDFSESDLIIFNTCSIRQKAEDKCLGYMRDMAQLKRKNPNLVVALTGCMVRKSSSRYSVKRDQLLTRVQEVDIALRIEDLPQLADLIREIHPDFKIAIIPEENLEDYFKIDANHTSQAQAFVPVSTGCDKFCTYCIVPYSRGREKSRSIQDIVKECENLVEKGCKEITLIGQTVNSYGLSIYDKINKIFADVPEGKEPFVHLLEQIDQLHERGLSRLRFTSPHPKDMSDQLITAMANLKTLMPYLHLPVQAGDDRTLKRMNRTYTTEKYREIIKKLRQQIPDISISTDVIVGFCDESDDEFENTYNFFKEMNFEHGYLAQYSERKGTFADQHIKDNIPDSTKKERWTRLNDLLREHSIRAHERFLDQTVQVLVENQKGDKCYGRTEHFKTVEFESRKNLQGKIVPVKIVNSREWILHGEMA